MSELSGAAVLVTGSDGFIGSHLVERLVAEGARVRAFCLYNSQGSLGWLDGIERRLQIPRSRLLDVGIDGVYGMVRVCPGRQVRLDAELPADASIVPVADLPVIEYRDLGDCTA